MANLNLNYGKNECKHMIPAMEHCIKNNKPFFITPCVAKKLLENTLTSIDHDCTTVDPKKKNVNYKINYVLVCKERGWKKFAKGRHLQGEDLITLIDMIKLHQRVMSDY